MVPKANPEFLVGMKDKKSGKLVGFIAGTPITLNLRDDI